MLMFFGPFSPIPELYLFCEYFLLHTYPVETTDIQTHSYGGDDQVHYCIYMHLENKGQMSRGLERRKGYKLKVQSTGLNSQNNIKVNKNTRLNKNL